MVQLIKPNQVVVTTKAGECRITLDINIHLDGQGKYVGMDAKQAEDTPDDFKWAIPDFQAEDFIDFGKEVEE